ncbi:hypothetical protein PMAYCL1PPCAC_04632, partial [Pristionchus mayeri]
NNSAMHHLSLLVLLILFAGLVVSKPAKEAYDPPKTAANDDFDEAETAQLRVSKEVANTDDEATGNSQNSTEEQGNVMKEDMITSPPKGEKRCPWKERAAQGLAEPTKTTKEVLIKAV